MKIVSKIRKKLAIEKKIRKLAILADFVLIESKIIQNTTIFLKGSATTYPNFIKHGEIWSDLVNSSSTRQTTI